jgi:hypothetical protein
MKLLALLLLTGCAGGDLRHEGTTTICILAVCPTIELGVDVEIERKKRDAK